MKTRDLLLGVGALAVLLLASTAAAECVVSPDRTNDNYCDCPETAQDEPLTSACSPRGMFKCFDRAVFFPSSRVHDGVCDCCDGSDEQPGFCQNTCEEIDRLERERLAELTMRKREGEKGFFALVEKAKTMCDAPKQDDPDTNQEKDAERLAGEDELLREEATLDELEEANKEETRKTRRTSLYLEKLSREDLEEVLIDLAEEAHGGSTLERLLAAKLPCASNEDEDVTDDLAADEVVDESEEDTSTCDPVWSETIKPSSSELVEVRERVRELRERWGPSKPTDDTGTENDELPKNIDYGPAQVWRAIRKECFSLKKEQYTYELCIFGEFKQDHVRLGTFASWSKPHVEQMYEHGDMCYSPAVARSVKVKVECGAASELVDIYEPSTCVYEAVFRTPAACVPENVDAIASGVCSA